MSDAIFVSTNTHACLQRFADQATVPVMCMRSRTHSTIQALATVMAIQVSRYVTKHHTILGEEQCLFSVSNFVKRLNNIIFLHVLIYINNSINKYFFSFINWFGKFPALNLKGVNQRTCLATVSQGGVKFIVNQLIFNLINFFTLRDT